jgi:hypothetical protein
MRHGLEYSCVPASYCGADGIGLQWDAWQGLNRMNVRAAAYEGDPNLRSIAEVKGYHIHALDGHIGHLTDFLIDDENWVIDCALVDTKNWWAGKHVLLPASAITEINWSGRYMSMDLTRYKIRSGQPWTEPDWSDTAV